MVSNRSLLGEHLKLLIMGDYKDSEIIDRFVFSPEGKIRNRLIDLLPSVGQHVTGVEPAHRLLKNAEVCDGKPRQVPPPSVPTQRYPR